VTVAITFGCPVTAMVKSVALRGMRQVVRQARS
jgi:hypothetical protein